MLQPELVHLLQRQLVLLVVRYRAQQLLRQEQPESPLVHLLSSQVPHPTKDFGMNRTFWQERRQAQVV